DVVDFNRTCPAPGAPFLPLSGIPIYYSRCGACDFMFAAEMCGWTPEQFLERVYNDDYALYDPDYVEARPQANADFLIHYFKAGAFTHLDYGGGNGGLSRRRAAAGWPSVSYDPLLDAERPQGPFDLVTSFEVFEHVPDINVLFSDLQSLVKADGLIMFSTLLSDGEIARGRPLSWWYAAPRNGHISLFSSQSLRMCLNQRGFNLASASANLHLAYRDIPPWASALLKGH
ncbi:MAG: class I SAM-dependent methyltransferase, partial [Caldimonas sp.]